MAEIGGIGEIGLWCSLGRGKRQNRSSDDGTSQGYQSGKEERLRVRDRIGNHRTTVGFHADLQGT